MGLYRKPTVREGRSIIVIMATMTPQEQRLHAIYPSLLFAVGLLKERNNLAKKL